MVDVSSNSFVKIIQYDPEPSSRRATSTPKPPPPKTKRVVTATRKWDFVENDFGDDFQYAIAKRMHADIGGGTCEGSVPQSKIDMAVQQIRAKICGYRAQDLLKHIYDESAFVTFERIVELMYACELNCFYCKEGVQIVYEFVREPKQWSLERIDNEYGHNHDNVVIACLSCNLRRRTMHYERYVATKQMQFVKKV